MSSKSTVDHLSRCTSKVVLDYFDDHHDASLTGWSHVSWTSLFKEKEG